MHRKVPLIKLFFKKGKAIMAKTKVVLDQRTYICMAECLYRDTHYKEGNEVEMTEREAVFLVNSGKFKLKDSKKESASVTKKTTKEVTK